MSVLQGHLEKVPTALTFTAFCQQSLQSKRFVVFLAFLSVLLIGIADYLTGTEINIAIFYLLPVSFAAWFGGRSEGVLVSVLATTVSFASDGILGERRYSNLAIPYWNLTMRGGVSVIVVLLLSRLKVALLHEKETSQIKTDMLSLVTHLNLTLTSNLDLHDVGKSFLEAIELFFPGCVTNIRLLNQETGNLDPFVADNLDEREWKSEASHLAASPEFIQMKTPKIVRNVQNESSWNIEFCRKNNLVSYLGFPLNARSESLGFISLYTKREHAFTNEEITFFMTLASQAAIALQNARLFEEVRTGHRQLRELSRRLLDIQETERREIARELHDEIGQLLTGLKIALEMTPHLGLLASTRIVKAQSIVNDLILRVRGLSLDLRPLMLDDLGLLPTLLWHIERYTSMTGVEVHLSHDGLEGKRFDPRIETVAYRIVQEALTNVARHSGANHATVQVWCIPDTLIVEITDDGRGFDVEGLISVGKANGLTGMRERAMLLHGALNIDSTAGAGTSIIAELPLGESNTMLGEQCLK